MQCSICFLCRLFFTLVSLDSAIIVSFSFAWSSVHLPFQSIINQSSQNFREFTISSMLGSDIIYGSGLTTQGKQRGINLDCINSLLLCCIHLYIIYKLVKYVMSCFLHMVQHKHSLSAVDFLNKKLINVHRY